MLHYETIDAPTLDLLKNLMLMAELKNHLLVGGTSLALQIGHRKSIDIDLFGTADLINIELENMLIQNFKTFSWLRNSGSVKTMLINGIKTDIVHYKYPWISQVLVVDGIRLAGKKDIAAMKLAAITGRGTKKDFIDLYLLLKEYSLSEMMGMYREKYSDGSEFLVIKSLVYFEDAEENEMPKMLIPVSWQQVKKTITKEHRNYLAGI